ncbi:MAG: hypothetical protein ABID38_02830, partial [Candidatus Diapherotrites archaeon]
HDETKPVISNEEPAPGSIINDTTPTIAATVHDADSDIDISSIILTIDGQSLDFTQLELEYLDLNYNPDNGRVEYTPDTQWPEDNYAVNLYVADLYGLDDKSSWGFTISSNVEPPPEVVPQVLATIAADPQKGFSPLSVSFDLNCFSTVDPISYCNLELGDGNEFSPGEWSKIVIGSTEHTYYGSSKKIFSAKLTAEAGGISNSSSVSITVAPVDEIFPLELNLYSYDAETGEASYGRTFIAEASGGVLPYLYEWDFESDGVIDLEGNEPNARPVFSLPGTYTTTVKVSDSKGAQISETINTAVTEKYVPPGQKEYDLQINVLSPELDKTYGYGQLVYFKVEILLDGKPIPNEYVGRPYISGTGDTLENYFNYNKDEDAYEISNLEMPSKNEATDFQEYDLRVDATVEGQEIIEYKKIKIKLSNKVNIEYLYPLDSNLRGATAFDPENPNKIVLNITYPDGSHYFKEAPILAKYHDLNTGVKTKIQLWDKKDHYEASLDYELREGENTFEILLEEVNIESEPRTVVSVLVKPIDWLSIVLVIVAVAVLLLAIYFTSSLLRERARIRRHLELERRNLKGLAKKLKFEYYKRHISDKEYKERLLNAQQQLATVDSLLGVKEDVTKRPHAEKEVEKKEVMKKIETRANEEKKTSVLGGFGERMDKIMRKNEQAVEKDLTSKMSESEREEIKRLVFVLEKSVSNYSREEMTNAILAQGYSPQVAEKVVEMLYK